MLPMEQLQRPRDMAMALVGVVGFLGAALVVYVYNQQRDPEPAPRMSPLINTAF